MGGTSWSEVFCCKFHYNQIVLLLIALTIPRTISQGFEISGVIDERTVVACENKLLTISCLDVGKNSRMRIVNANYGRLNNETCDQWYYLGWNTNCRSSNSMNIVKTACLNDTQNCSIWVSNSVFGDPCPRTSKYLEVHYKCISDFCSINCSANMRGFSIWQDPNCGRCVSEEFQEILEQIGRLENVTHLNANEVAKIATSLSHLTNKTIGLTAGNLNASVRAIVRLTTLREDHNKSLKREEIGSIVQTISNLLQPSNTNAWTELEKVNRTMAAALMWSGDVYGSWLVSSMNEADNTPTKEVAENMVLEARIIRKENLPSNIRFNSSETDQRYRNRKDWISLPSAALDLDLSTPVKIWGSFYQHLEEYLPGKDESILDSRVVSLSIDGIRKGQNLKQPITITLNHKMRQVMKHTRHCVFWNFDSVGGGNWSETGCKVKTSDSEHTVCICDHLTNFAILMSQHPSDSVALSNISTVGCIISVVALILTVIIYSVTWKQAKSDQAVVLMNLCVALIIANVIFLAGVDEVIPRDGCTVVAVLLHYFFLASFFIMLAEGVELLLYVIFVFHVRPKSETTKMIVAAWTLPLLIVVISLGVTRAIGYGSEKSCWLAVENGVIWAFIAPVLCIIGINLVILGIAFRKIFLAKMPSNQKQKYTKIRATLWNMSVIFPVLGIGWVSGILSVSFSSVVFQYIFAIANSIQGLLIFIFHALFRNQEINKNLSTLFFEIVSSGFSARSDSTQQTAAKETSEEKQRSLTQDTVPTLVNYYEELEEKNTLETKATQHSSASTHFSMDQTEFEVNMRF